MELLWGICLDAPFMPERDVILIGAMVARPVANRPVANRLVADRLVADRLGIGACV
jgi:hypothetical protein